MTLFLAEDFCRQLKTNKTNVSQLVLQFRKKNKLTEARRMKKKKTLGQLLQQNSYLTVDINTNANIDAEK